MQSLFLFVLIALFALYNAEPQVEEGVIVMTDANFDEVLAANPLLLVEVYHLLIWPLRWFIINNLRCVIFCFHFHIITTIMVYFL